MPFLPRYYKRFGFEVTSVLKFADKYAPEHWDFSRLDRPPIAFFRLRDDIDIDTYRHLPTPKMKRLSGQLFRPGSRRFLEPEPPIYTSHLPLDGKEPAGLVSEVQELARGSGKGWFVRMTPREFLRLNPPREVGQSTLEFLKDHLSKGGLFGSPFLEVRREGSGWKIFGHEGRARMQILSEVAPDTPVEVAIFPLLGSGKGRVARDEIANLKLDPIRPDRRAASKKAAQFVAEDKPQKASGRFYFRGSVSGDPRRIRTGDQWWDKQLFAATSIDAARPYGDAIQRLTIVPGARILREGTKTFEVFARRAEEGGAPVPSRQDLFWARQGRAPRNMLEWASRIGQLAAADGWDVLEFQRQSDLGSVILNPSVVAKRVRIE
jgi:hypothetical protein